MVEERKLKVRHERVHAKIPLAWEAPFEGTIYNISLGGLYFRSNAAPEIGRTLRLSFTIPQGHVSAGQQFDLQGSIRWVSTHSFEGNTRPTYGVGVEFEDLSGANKDLLHAFVKAELDSERQNRRMPVRIVVDYHFSGQNFRGIANDISRNGLFLVTPDPLQLDDMMQLKFALSEVGERIEARGIVRWRHEGIPEKLSSIIAPGMGIEFINIPQAEQALIDEFLENYFGDI